MRKQFILLSFIFVLALALRTLPFLTTTFAGGRAIFHDTDPYYHMRRVAFLLENDFRMPEFDWYLDYPNGGVSFWPPGFDRMLAAFIWTANAGSVTKGAMERTACWFPPLIGALTIFLVWLLGREVFSDRVGLFAAFLMALQPTHISYSELGKVDHHCAETFSAFLFYYFFIRVLKSVRSPGPPAARSPGGPWLWSLLAGAGIWFSYMMWTGATLYVIPLFASAYLLLFHFSKKELSRYLNSCITMTLAALVLLLYPCLSSWWGRRFLFTHDALSLFQVSLFLGILLFFLLLAAVIRLLKPGRERLAIALFTVIFSLSGALLVKALSPQIFRVLTEGFALLAKRGEASYHVWLTTISEYMPLAYIDGRFIWQLAVANLSWGVFLVPPGLLFLHTSRIHRPTALFLAVTTVFLGMLAFQQSRYCYIFGFNVALLSAFSVFVVHDYLRAKRPIEFRTSIQISGWVEQFRSRFPFRRRPRLGLDGIFVLFVLFMLLKHFQMLSDALFAQPRGPILTTYDCETLEWIRDNTPETKGYRDLSRKPEYGIMNVWDWGHFIVYVAQRPAAVNPYGMGIDKMVAFYLAKTESEANRIMDRNECRYVLTSDPTPLIDGLRKISMRYPGETYRLLQFEGPMLRLPKREFLNLMGVKLHLHDGGKPYVPDMDVEGLQHYRLVYESPELSELQYAGGPVTTHKVKLFEYVKGARYLLKAKPGAEVIISLELRTNTGRRFVYENRTRGGPNGDAEIVLPYPTSGGTYPVKALGKYKVRTGAREFELDVPEDAVMGGATL